MTTSPMSRLAALFLVGALAGAVVVGQLHRTQAAPSIQGFLGEGQFTGGAGTPGPTGPQGATGATGGGALVTSSFTSTLAIDGAAVQLDATHDVDLSVSVKTVGSTTITSGFDVTVTLQCDATATPTTFADVGGGAQTGTIVIGLSLSLSQTAYSTLRTRVPAAWRCRLVRSATVGSPTTTIVGQVARVLG